MRNDLSPMPVILATIGVGLLSVMDALIKELAQHYSTLEVAAGRFAVGLVLALLVFAFWRSPWPSREAIWWNTARGIVVVFSAYGFFYGLGVLPLAEAIALTFVAPVFIVLMGAAFLKEPISGSIIWSLVLGAAGLAAMVIETIGTGTARGDRLLGYLAILGSCVTYAGSIIMLRARTAHDPLPFIVFMQNLVPALVFVPLSIPVFVMPAEAHWPLFLAMGTLGVIGHLVISVAFSRAPASRLGPIDYTAFVWAVGLGWVFFGEVPSLATWIGAGLIVTSAIIVGRTKPAANPPSTTPA
jgi:drug/metabolite transporter (DMT)-like permease